MRIAVVTGETSILEPDDLSRSRQESCVLMDEETFRAFYERTARGLWAYISRVTGDRQLADDLVQETYYRFYRAGATHESETHRRNSLYCIATNAIRDAARRRGQTQIVPLPEPGDGDELRGDDRTAARVVGRADLARAMARLNERQRELLWLAYAHGASHGEIAETLGLTQSSIKTLLFRARKTLAQLLRASEKGEAR